MIDTSIKFLFVANLVPDRNTGAAGSLIAIAESLERQGHSVDIEWSDGQPYRLPPQLGHLYELPRRQLNQVWQRLKGTRYDVVIISQPYAHLVYERLPDRYPGTLFLNRTHGWEDRLYQAEEKLAWRLDRTSHARRAASWLSSRMIWSFCRRTAKSCHGMICPARRCADFICSAYGSLGDKVAVIPYGLDNDYLTGMKKAASPDSGLRMLFVGNYLARKGVRELESVLPDLARRYSDLSLTFVVQPEAMAHINQHFGPTFGERLAVRCWMPRRELKQEYQKHNVFLFPSLFEGFGKTYLEAMACGLCVVGFDEGGLSDLSTHGRDALFCTVGDENGLVQLLEWCAKNPVDVKTIGQRAMETASRYTWDEHASKTVDFCRVLFERRFGD